MPTVQKSHSQDNKVVVRRSKFLIMPENKFYTDNDIFDSKRPILWKGQFFFILKNELISNPLQDTESSHKVSRKSAIVLTVKQECDFLSRVHRDQKAVYCTN